MRILHTADWHLGDRLGRIDRTQDLRRAVERVGAYCRTEAIDVLLVAGDLFSELARPDSLRETIGHWQQVFGDFLASGGTILTLTGNHDNENFCRTLTHAMGLAAPMTGVVGELLPHGRLYLATEPTLLRLHDRQTGTDVQFLLMPYPTPSVYLRDDAGPKYTGPAEKNARLMAAFLESLRRMQRHEGFDPRLPTVLGAHVNVHGATIGPSLFRIAEQDDVVFNPSDLPSEFAYVALGHVHKPQALAGRSNLRYSGSIERMDLGESGDSKSVVVFDVTAAGLANEPRVLPLAATAVYEVNVHDPRIDLPDLQERYSDAADDLVNLHIRYTAGVDSLEDVLEQLEAIFPRWYARDWNESTALGPAMLAGPDAGRSKGFADTVRDYLREELKNHTPAECDEVLARAEALFREDDP